MAVIQRSRVQQLLDDELARFEREHPRSKVLFERAKASLLGGVPMNWMVRWAGSFPVFVQSQGTARTSPTWTDSTTSICAWAIPAR